MELLFLNTWHGKLHDELRQYIGDVRDTTDIFCLQEAHINNQGPYKDLFDDYETYYAEKEQEDLQLANVIFVRKGIEVVDNGTLLNEGSKIGFANYVVVKQGDNETVICNVHGIPSPGHKLDTPERLEQSQIIIDFFAHRNRVVVGGDFNLLPEAQSVRTFEEHGYRNLIGEYAIASTRNHIALDAYPDNPQQFADYVFITSGVDIADFTVPSDIVSDHQPLKLTIKA